MVTELARLTLARCFAFVSRERRPRLAFRRYCWVHLCLSHFVGSCSQLAVVDEWDDGLLDLVEDSLRATLMNIGGAIISGFAATAAAIRAFLMAISFL